VSDGLTFPHPFFPACLTKKERTLSYFQRRCYLDFLSVGMDCLVSWQAGDRHIFVSFYCHLRICPDLPFGELGKKGQEYIIYAYDLITLL
jgi:hypothetical protein